MLTKKEHLKFTLNMFKVRRTHKKIIKMRLWILKRCIYEIIRIGNPKNNIEIKSLNQAIILYDNTVQELNNNIDRYRKLVQDLK